jgi:hypothetical protein
MVRVVLRSCFAVVLITAAYACVLWWQSGTAERRVIAKLEQQKQELEQQKQQLQQVVDRLGTAKRVADVFVTDQQAGEKPLTKLLFVEYDRTGRAMPPRELLIRGTNAHVEAMVIEFDPGRVVANDPLKGHAIALFTRIFGDYDTPAAAAAIDTPDQIPEFYKGTDAKVSAFEKRLWQTFWQLSRDAALRQEMGVRVAIGKGIWGPFEPEMLYTLTLQPDGNLSRTAEPMRGAYGTYIKLLRDRLGQASTLSPND